MGTVLLLSCIVVYTRTMKNLIIFSALIVLASAYPKDLLHAECSVKWTVSLDCESVQKKVVDQMYLWDNEDCETQPGDSAPHGQKCLYKHTGSDGLTFKFVPNNSGCLVDANSISESLSLLDFGTNY